MRAPTRLHRRLIVHATAFALALSCGSMLASHGHAAEQPPGAPGPQSWSSFRNGTLQQGVATSKLPAKLTLLWRVSSPDGIEATAAIVGDRVYIGTLKGDVLCLDKETGEEIWTVSVDRRSESEEVRSGLQGGNAGDDGCRLRR